MTDDEEVLGRLVGWFRRTPTSLEFWEGVLSTDRLVLCFVGESFSSALLRADMGERDREAIAAMTPTEVVAEYERTTVVPLAELTGLHLRAGSLLRRARLRVEFADGEVTLYSTKASDDQADLIERLAADDRLARVDVTVDRPGLFG